LLVRTILLHGAGSFGHFQARHFALSAGLSSAASSPLTDDATAIPPPLGGYLGEASGITCPPFVDTSSISSTTTTETKNTDASSTPTTATLSSSPTTWQCQRWGAAETRRSVLTLHQHFMDAFIAEGLPVIGISPHALITTDDAKLDANTSGKSLIRHIQQCFDRGFIPVLHGDVVFDSVRTWSILSGDKIMVMLANAFTATHCIFATDVNGVYHDSQHTKLLSLMHVDNDGTCVDMPSSQNTTLAIGVADVTGGMKAKINAAITMVHQAATSSLPRNMLVFIVAGMFCHRCR
jgi:isopentenyl phosphate kinase